MWLYKGKTCFVVTFSLPLSLPFDWTFKTWSMCLLFCLFWVDVMLWCCVWKEIKKNVDNKKKNPEKNHSFHKTIKQHNFFIDAS